MALTQAFGAKLASACRTHAGEEQVIRAQLF